MAPLSGALPLSTFEWPVIGEHDAEGEVARGGSCLQRVMQCEELDPSGALVGGRLCRTADVRALALRHPLEAGSSGEPQGAAEVAGDREGRNGQI